MAEVQVHATRMELLRQRKRLVLAQRGHRLLKNKRDELMHRFLELVSRTRGLRERVEEKLVEALRRFLVARAELSRECLYEALMTGAASAADGQLVVQFESVMNVLVPRFALAEDRRDVHAYGFATTVAELDQALGLLAEVLPDMVQLAELEQAIELLAEEIEKTRRRVNALEQMLIPQLEQAIKAIQMALDEMERATKAQLLRIKDIIRGEARA